MKKITLVISLLFLFTCFCNGAILHVPANYPTIQSALNSAQTGDTVLVEKGTYYENIVWPSTQGICLLSKKGPQKTVINGGGISSVIRITSGINQSTVINGFTITNGTGSPDYYGYYYAGGGINCMYSSPTIINNIITKNKSTNYGDGGGIYCFFSSPNIFDNTISENFSSYWGGGIFCFYSSSPVITGNDIIRNKSTMQGGAISIGYYCSALITENLIKENSNMERCGGGIIVGFNSNAIISDNVITNNLAHSNGGGIDYSYDCTGSINNNYISENKSIGGSGGGIFIGWGSSVSITENSITENSAPYGGGIGIEECASTTEIMNCIIRKNDGDGIYCAVSSNPLINNNDLLKNNGYGILNTDSTITINAENNWWGHKSGPGGYGSGKGDEVSSYVDFTPWLTKKNGSDKFEPSSVNNKYELTQNYPNPFNPMTTIRFKIPESSFVRLIVYDILGRQVSELINKKLDAGAYDIKFDGSKLSNGIYFYRIYTENYTETKSMMLVK